MNRYARVTGNGVSAETIGAYLPGNYEVIGVLDYLGNGEQVEVIIGGQDNAGWTMEDYVIPRLGSGLYRVEELTA